MYNLMITMNQKSVINMQRRERNPSISPAYHQRKPAKMKESKKRKDQKKVIKTTTKQVTEWQ